MVALKDGRLRERVSRFLRDQGWRVIEAGDGGTVLAELADVIVDGVGRVPALAVLDEHLPGCHGVSLAQGFRELGWSTRAVVVGRFPRPNSGFVPAGSLFVRPWLVLHDALVRPVARARRHA